MKGIAASSGYATGKVFLKPIKEIVIEEKKDVDIRLEKKRLEDAIEASKQQLITLKKKTAEEIGYQEAEVFESHRMMLCDPEFIESSIQTIENENCSAEKAVTGVMGNFLSIFAGMEDEYMKERAADLKDVRDRVLGNLTGSTGVHLSDIGENTVVVAHDLTPSDTAQLDKNKVVAFLTDMGGRTSHSAILARTLEIPAVVGLIDITSSVKNGDTVIVDGVNGIVMINPDEETVISYENKRIAFQAEKEKLKKLVHTKTVTKSGKEVLVAGNIGSPEDIHKVIENGGEGVGLFRTEFLFMDRHEIPNEEEQFEAYRYVAEKMEGKPVAIRTLDIGGDKKLSYLPMPEEMNPFLGYRAIRLCLDNKELFKIQLRAILRASAFGNVQIMFPMISALSEFLKAKEILNECMLELENEGKAFNKNLEVGIMVEIPAAAMIADELAQYVDFFSIGTNDLVQYTLAADRMNEKVSYLYDPMHPAVLKLIKMTIDAAHKQGKWCGMCGEMAGDIEAIPTLLEYGLDEFSMSASSILKARDIIINN